MAPGGPTPPQVQLEVSGRATSVSEQHFVHLDTTFYGCTGGLMDSALTFAEKNDIAKVTRAHGHVALWVTVAVALPT